MNSVLIEHTLRAGELGIERPLNSQRIDFSVCEQLQMKRASNEKIFEIQNHFVNRFLIEWQVCMDLS